MAKPGRPKGTKRAGPKKNVAIRLEVELYDKVLKRAKGEGRSISNYVRRLMENDVK